MRDLHQPAQAPSIPVPKAAVASSVELSEEDDLLGALLAHLGDAGSLADRVQHLQQSNVRSIGKLLHKEVARQTEARTQLRRLTKDRQTFLDGWADYLATSTGNAQKYRRPSKTSIFRFASPLAYLKGSRMLHAARLLRLQEAFWDLLHTAFRLLPSAWLHLLQSGLQWPAPLCPEAGALLADFAEGFAAQALHCFSTASRSVKCAQTS